MLFRSISAPVWGPGSDVVGALTLTLPEQRMQPAFTDKLRQAAAEATLALGGSAPKG